jgi:hypothetical protein
MVRRAGTGCVASVLVLAGLVAFGTEASAHNDVFESVTASCNAPGTGAGTTLNWKLSNDWALSETGTLSTSQGSLSTTALSIAASPTNNAAPPAAASQTVTQTLTATELAALSPSSTLSVHWSATWTDGSAGSGTLTTTLSRLNLPNSCSAVKTTPTIASTLVPPMSSTVGNSWSDSATVSGVWGGGMPSGSVSFYVCTVSPSPSSSGTCNDPTGTLVGTVSTMTATTDVTATYDLWPITYTPPRVGTYCFSTLYEPSDATVNYLPVWGPSECFTVGPVTPSIATALVEPSSTSVGNVWSDSATVTGDATEGAPTGAVSFSVCKVVSGNTACASGGTLVGTVGSPSLSSGDVSTYDLMPAAYSPPNVGTYCFFSTYIPAAAGTDTTAGGPPECFTVTPADPQFGTQQSGSASGSGTIKLGGSLTDTAAVTGNSVGGAPTGTVTFTLCATGSSTAVCPSGTAVGSPVALTASGDVGTATSASYRPAAAGTYCFAAVYTPAANANYVTATDNMGGAVQATECVVVLAATTAVTTVTPTVTPPSTKTSAPLAFTGARLSEEWVAGLGALLLGAALLVLVRRRRRIPGRAAE